MEILINWIKMNMTAAIAIAAGVLVLIILIIVLLVRRRRPRIDVGGNFELYCADLLAAVGYTDVERTPASGDFGVDLLGDLNGITWAFQCKCYENHPVGVHAVQEVYAGRDYYHCHVGVVMTNNVFTKSAKAMAEELGILLWDGDTLESMAKRGGR